MVCSMVCIVKITFKKNGEDMVKQYMVSTKKNENEVEALIGGIGYWEGDYALENVELVKAEIVQKITLEK